jgi:hypothetical protein
MGFAKFVSLLQRKALFFSRLDRLGADVCEGAVPRATRIWLETDLAAPQDRKRNLAEEFQTGARSNIFVFFSAHHIPVHKAASRSASFDSVDSAFAVSDLFARR